MKLTSNPTYVNLPGRAVAGIIDWQIGNLPFLYSLTLLVAATTLAGLTPVFINTVAFIWLPMALFYPLFIVILLSKTGYTPGKAILGIRIADSNRSTLTFLRSVFRELIAKRVSAALLMLGVFTIATDPNHQGWHDHFSESYAYPTGNRLILGIGLALILAGTQVYLGYIIITNFLANQALIGDLQFLFEPLLKLIN